MKDRLSNIEILPDACADAVLWLYDMIVSRRMAQVDMLVAFNARLSRLDEKPVSLSGLNRYVQKVRSGSISRPKIASAPASLSASGGILCPAFRTSLVHSIHEPAVLALEVALATLAGTIPMKKDTP